mgnify:CR=1 FL=1
MTCENLIEICDLSRSFAGASGSFSALRRVDLTIPRGSFTVIRGASGAGKSTLLRILGLLDTGFGGQMRFAGHDVAGLAIADRDELRTALIGLVFQDGRLLPHLSLEENIALPLQFTAETPVGVRARVDQALGFAFRPEELAGGVAALRPGAASGGQRQRAAMARAMIHQPVLILADEPTASLDAESKALVVARLREMHDAGATVVVVSHDEALFGVGRQFLLEEGRLIALQGETEVGLTPLQTALRPLRSVASAPLAGWWPRLGLGRQIRAALRDLLRRPLFTLLLLIAVIAGTAQSAVFLSLVAGLDSFVTQSVADGSRLTRITLKPRKADLAADDHFPDEAALAAAPDVAAVVARRASTVAITGADGTSRPFPSLGLHPDDPELAMFRFVAGGGFAASGDQLQMIVTTDFLIDLYGPAPEGTTADWASFVGRQVEAAVPHFSRSGKVTGTEPVVLTICGVILKAEGDRQFYLPNDVLIALDAIKRDRSGTLTLPLTPDRAAWAKGADRTAVLDWPWQDMMHLYLRDIDAVVPKVATLSRQGYRPEAEIWKFAWVLDLKAAAYGIAAPLLALLSGVIAVVLVGNIIISARLREAELALMKVLGMRRGDILAVEVIGTCVTTGLGLVAGLAIADRLTAALAQSFAERARLQAELSGGAAQDQIGLLFQPVWPLAPGLAAITLALVLVALLWPTLRAASTDPARVFARN